MDSKLFQKVTRRYHAILMLCGENVAVREREHTKAIMDWLQTPEQERPKFDRRYATTLCAATMFYALELRADIASGEVDDTGVAQAELDEMRKFVRGLHGFMKYIPQEIMREYDNVLKKVKQEEKDLWFD